MKQLTLHDFMDILEDAATEASSQSVEQDETPTRIDEPVCKPCCDEDKHNTTVIEDCIVSFLEHCTAQGTIPTLEQAKSIHILDSINSKYN